jgi:hypothetical protein
MRQETVRILCEVVFLKVILVIHALLKFVTALVNNLLSVLLISSLGYLLILYLFLLLVNVFR